MLTPEEQMQVIKSAYAEGYKGRVYELIDQASIAKAQDEGTSGPIPNLPPSLQQSSTNLPFELTAQEQGNLVQSQMSTPPGMQNLSMASGENPIIEPGQYEEGGFKSEDEDNKIDSNGNLDEDYDFYTSTFEETDTKKHVSYYEYERLQKKYGDDIASGYFRNENDKVSNTFENWVKNPKREAIGWENVGRMSESQQNKYYELLYPNVEDREYHRNFNQTQFTKQDEIHKELGIGKYATDESAESSDVLGGWTPEFTLEEDEFYATPDTWAEDAKGTGHYYNPFNAAARAEFAQEWNRFDRVKGNYGFFDYWTDAEDTRTYAPSYNYGNDVRNINPNTGDSRIFYADANGNPVGTHYKDGTPYDQRILEWRDNSGNTSSLDKSVIDDGSKLKKDMKAGEDILYRDVPLTSAAVLFGPRAIQQGLKYGSMNLTRYAGTSLFDAAGYYGGYEGVTNLPGHISEFKENPSWSGAGNIALDIVGIGGFGLSTLNASKNFITKADDVADVINSTKVANTPKSTTSGTVADDVTYTPVNASTKSGGKASKTDDIIPTKEEINIIDRGVNKGHNHYKTNITHPRNEELLNNMGPWGQQWKNNWNNAVHYQVHKPYTISGKGHHSSQLGQSGQISTQPSGYGTMINAPRSPHYTSKFDGSWSLLDDGTAIPRYSEVNINQNVASLRNKLKYTSGSKDDIIKNFEANVSGTAGHETHHAIGLTSPRGRTSNYSLSGKPTDPNYANQPAISFKEGTVNIDDFITTSQRAKIDDPVLSNMYLPKFNTKWNPKTNSFDEAVITDPDHLKILEDMASRPGPSGYTSRLHYKGDTKEVTADLIGFRTRFNLGHDKFPTGINSKQASEIFKHYKKVDKQAASIYQNSDAFMNMFNKVPYSIVPPTLGIGLYGGSEKRKGGFKKKKCKYGCW